MKSFARTTKLPSISGRAGYMSDPGKQEEIVLESEKVDWSEYIEYEKYNQKTNLRNNEGREMMVTLPNDWYHLPKDELKNRIDLIAKTTVGKDREYQWAVHWNKNRTNLHVHIIFSERQRVKEPGRWDRDVYLGKDNKVARRKSDRVTDEDGNYILIHRKGDLKDPFTAKDASFKSKEWLHEKKQELRQLMVEQWGVKFERQPHLPEFHEGKGPESEIIKKKNIVIRENNRRLDVLESQGVNISGLVQELKAARANARNNPDQKDRTALLWQDSQGEYKVTVFHNPDRAILQIENTAGRFAEEKIAEVRPEPQPEKAAPEVPAISDPKQELPEIPVVSDKKEVNREPVAPVERKSFIERIRDTISSFIARQQPTENRQQAVPEPEPERQRVYTPEPKTDSERLKKALSDYKAAQAKGDEARVNHLAATKLPFWDKTKKPKMEKYRDEVYAAEREKQDAFSRIEKLGVSMTIRMETLCPEYIKAEHMEILIDRVNDRVKQLQQEEAPQSRKPSLQQTIKEAQESVAVQRYKQLQKEIAPAVEARLKEKSKGKSQGQER